MTYDEFAKQLQAIKADADFSEIHISPDFQCDQTGGFPTSLCACFEKGKAWLELNENLLMDRDEMELDYYRQLCADFGIRDCADAGQFNTLLQNLGEDAYNSAYIPEEDESLEMGGM